MRRVPCAAGRSTPRATTAPARTATGRRSGSRHGPRPAARPASCGREVVGAPGRGIVQPGPARHRHARRRRGAACYKSELGERPLWDFPDGLWRREVAAYELDRALGTDLVPTTVARDDGPFGPGSLQWWVGDNLEDHYFTLRERDEFPNGSRPGGVRRRGQQRRPQGRPRASTTGALLGDRQRAVLSRAGEAAHGGLGVRRARGGEDLLRASRRSPAARRPRGDWLTPRGRDRPIARAASSRTRSTPHPTRRTGRRTPGPSSRPAGALDPGGRPSGPDKEETVSEETWEAVDGYFASLLAPDDDALRHALATSREAGLPDIQITPTQGRLLQLLAKSVGARRILEVGTLGGYSTIWLARAPRRGRAPRQPGTGGRPTPASRWRTWRTPGSTRWAEVRVGDARASLAELVAAGTEPVRLLLHRRRQAEQPGVLRARARHSHPGSLIVVDNVVRSGAVADAKSTDANVVGVLADADQRGRGRLARRGHGHPDRRRQGLRRLRPLARAREDALGKSRRIAGRLEEVAVQEQVRQQRLVHVVEQDQDRAVPVVVRGAEERPSLSASRNPFSSRSQRRRGPRRRPRRPCAVALTPEPAEALAAHLERRGPVRGRALTSGRSAQSRTTSSNVATASP